MQEQTILKFDMNAHQPTVLRLRGGSDVQAIFTTSDPSEMPIQLSSDAAGLEQMNQLAKIDANDQVKCDNALYSLNVSANCSTNVAKQLEKLNEVRESLYSVNGWGGDQVNQTNKWILDSIASDKGDVPWADSGTRIWENVLPELEKSIENDDQNSSFDELQMATTIPHRPLNLLTPMEFDRALTLQLQQHLQKQMAREEPLPDPVEDSTTAGGLASGFAGITGFPPNPQWGSGQSRYFQRKEAPEAQSFREQQRHNNQQYPQPFHPNNAPRAITKKQPFPVWPSAPQLQASNLPMYDSFRYQTPSNPAECDQSNHIMLGLQNLTMRDKGGHIGESFSALPSNAFIPQTHQAQSSGMPSHFGLSNNDTKVFPFSASQTHYESENDIGREILASLSKQQYERDLHRNPNDFRSDFIPLFPDSAINSPATNQYSNLY